MAEVCIIFFQLFQNIPLIRPVNYKMNRKYKRIGVQFWGTGTKGYYYIQLCHAGEHSKEFNRSFDISRSYISFYYF